MPDITYPDTPAGETVDSFFGTEVADPYRWLEQDMHQDADVADWVAAQTALTERVLAALPGREPFRARLTALFDYEQIGVPLTRGGRQFFLRNAGLSPQLSLQMRQEGEDRVLIDPNTWSEDGTIALAEWAVSDGGTHLVFARQEAGSDWRTLRVLDVDGAVLLEDRIDWARATTLEWAPDGSGFFYNRYPEPEGDAGAALLDHQVWFHRLGTPQSEDRQIHATPGDPALVHPFVRSNGGRYLIIHSMAGMGANAMQVIDLQDPAWAPRALPGAFEGQGYGFGNDGTTLYAIDSSGAERGRIVSFDLAQAAPEPTVLVPESAGAMQFAWLLGGELLVSYLVDARTEIRRFDLDGRPLGVLELPGIGTAPQLRGDPSSSVVHIGFTSFVVPPTIYAHDLATGETSLFAAPEVPVDLSQFAVEQRFYTAADGTRVPMFIVRRQDVSGPAPTVLYGYGGFGLSPQPLYSPAVLAWVEQGGVYAVANIRGGGEYGQAWHEAGRLLSKQTSFDDFIAAAEYLKDAGIAARTGLAIMGESGGGLLVGAVTNRRPDLFAAAVPSVGVMDMLRYSRFTGGGFWLAEFGSPENEVHFANLRSYSPYHTIAEGEDYPAILVTTGDTDTRVVPAHSFKYAAALQAADIGPGPHLLRVATRAGHGGGQSTEMMIDELADTWAFVAAQTGLEIR